MLYEIEEVKTKRSKKLIIAYIIALLLVFVIAVCLGIFVAKKMNTQKQNLSEAEKNASEIDNNVSSEEPKEDVPNDTMVIVQDDNSKKSFIQNVENIYNGEEGKRVFLTFDDGPSKSVTPYILDILKKYNIKATFFVLGSRISNNAELLKREYDEGHYIGNHGYSHKYSKIYASSNALLEEYNKTEQKIREALNKPDYSSNLFRFPGGSVGGPYDDIKTKCIKELTENNIAYLDWNALTNDADGANTKEKIMKNLKETVGNKNNVVVLMHDAPDKILTYETLEDVINYLQKNGYAFKNMYDLMDTEE